MRWYHSIALALPVAFLLAGFSPPPHSRYLFVWASEAANPKAETRAGAGFGQDFLATFDIALGASPFGRLVAMLPVGSAEGAHHTNYTLPANDVLYANDWHANASYVFDVRQPSHPALVRKFGDAGGFGYPHSFLYLTNGDTLATFQYSGGMNHAPGGLVEFDAQGSVVKTSSAAVPAIDPNIRPYSLAVIEKLDRVVTGSSDMIDSMGRLNTMTDNVANQTIVSGAAYGPANELTTLSAGNAGWSGLAVEVLA